ncbi:MAG: hypothetical protein ACD_75C00302G0014 [uncultured bacterium]|nr:MAG: hypothetical protein ACD_75C00302G0014 [uncultured bacterium]HBG17825.1 hypothetical protein [Desulfobulbaceae bacterium]
MMTNKSLILTLLFVMVAAEGKADNLTAPPEVPTAIELSNRDINRIVCPGRINDLIFSEEKGLTGHFAENNAFIKFKIEQLGDERSYAEDPSEIFVVCDNSVYTLIATPKDIASVTLRLTAAPQKALHANIQAFNDLPLEKRVLQVIREAYGKSYQSGYRIVEIAEEIFLSSELNLTLTKIVNVDGVGLRLKEFTAKSASQDELTVEEAFFLNPAISESLLAVAVDNHTLQPGESTRVFVVEQKELDQ